jgi:predicted metal-dependent phosphoesterase TrpH
MGRADLQVHSDLGDGLSSIEEILDSAEKARLDVIALTDHDDIRGAFALRDLAAQRSSPVAVVPGVEVTTRSGHLLALWIEEEIPMFCSLADALSLIHQGGGLAIVPHPLSYLTFSIGEGALRQLASSGDNARMVDAIELRNPSYAGRVRASRAAWLNTHVGTCWTEFPGSSPEHLRAALGEHATTADGRRWTLGEHLEGAATQQWRSMVRDPIKRARRRMARAGGGKKKKS